MDQDERSGERMLEVRDHEKKFWDDDEWEPEELETAETELVAKQQAIYTPRKRLHPNQAWNKFYRNNKNNFFKDRHYLIDTFPDEFHTQDSTKVWFELGCGVGNAVLPMLKYWKGRVYGIDCSQVAIDCLQEQASDEERVYVKVADLCSPDIFFPQVQADVVTLIFTLSAMPTNVDRKTAVAHAHRVTRTGGTVIVRDYGRCDQAQFKLAHKWTGESYRKGDGTAVYYFKVEDLRELFEGWEELALEYIQRKYINRATGEVRRRVWIQARFKKPII